MEIADNKDCESIAAGVTRYAYKPAAQGEISTEMMYITHKQLATTSDLKASFDELNDYLSGGKRPGEMDLGEPEAFRFYCSGAAHGYVTDFGAYYPGVDQAKAVILLSGQAVAEKYNQQSLTYNIFARKGDHLLMIQYVGTVDEVLSPIGESKCLENVSGPAGLNWSCVAKEINSDLNATGKIKSKVNELISHFELKQ